MAMLPFPRIRIVNWTADKTASMRSFKKTTRHACIFYFSSVKYHFCIRFQNKYKLEGEGGSSTKPPIGYSSVDPTG